MLNQPTLEKLRAMKLTGLADAFERQMASAEYASLGFEDRLGLLVDAEWDQREQRKLTRRLQRAKLRFPASLEDVDFKAPRGLDRRQVLSLGQGAWIREHLNLLITGPTGTGKDGEPGVKTVWRGLAVLEEITCMYERMCERFGRRSQKGSSG